jgi:two-component system nitrate/nitrite response regulator NarL
MSQVPLVVIEPNMVLRLSLCAFLATRDFEVVEMVASPSELAAKASSTPSLAVVISSTEGCCLKLIAEVKVIYPAAVIVVFGGSLEMKSALDLLAAGANAYLNNSTTSDAFFKTLELAAHGLTVVSVKGVSLESHVSSNAVKVDGLNPVSATADYGSQRPDGKSFSQTLDPASFQGQRCSSLSPREISILQLIRDGSPNKLIAIRLNISEATVKVHMKSIMRKISAKNRTQAAVWLSDQAQTLANGVDGPRG